jgi:hypothetical protein
MRIVILLFLLVAAGSGYAVTKNGFDLRGASIPVAEILSGGPPRDGIPALTDPELVAAEAARYLKPDDRVLGVVLDGEARAYPIRILDWHELVNDSIGTQRFVVSYCPLCGSGMVFESTHKDTLLNFGVSGLLYNSDVLLYDRQSASLWSQLKSVAVSGPMKGARLAQIPALHTTWQHWRKRHPGTLVLSARTGYQIDYSKSPYAGYEKTRQIYFGVSHKAPRHWHPKERILGVEIEGQSKAYAFAELSKNGQQSFFDSIGQQRYQVHWNESEHAAWVTGPEGQQIATTVVFWFAWYTFHPGTEIYRAP